MLVLEGGRLLVGLGLRRRAEEGESEILDELAVRWHALHSQRDEDCSNAVRHHRSVLGFQESAAEHFRDARDSVHLIPCQEIQVSFEAARHTLHGNRTQNFF